MSEIHEGEFKPLVPIYGAYPIPAVFEALDITGARLPEKLFWSGDIVIEQMLRASIERPSPKSLSPRMENHLPLITTGDTIVTRTSHERKIKGDPEVSRQITDRLTFEELGDGDTGFDRLRLTIHSDEYRSDKGHDREIEIDTWSILFYRPGMDQPGACVRKASRFVDSYIEVSDEDKRHRYGWPEANGLRTMQHIEVLGIDYPEILREFEAAMLEAQNAMFQPMLPALSNRDIVALRGASIGFQDPHTRHIGRVARLADGIARLRSK